MNMNLDMNLETKIKVNSSHSYVILSYRNKFFIVLLFYGF